MLRQTEETGEGCLGAGALIEDNYRLNFTTTFTLLRGGNLTSVFFLQSYFCFEGNVLLIQQE